MLNLKQTVPPAAEPVSLALAKAHCRIDNGAEDNLLSLYITAARAYVEKRLNRSLLSQAWMLSLDTFPWGGYRQLPGVLNSAPYNSECWFEDMTILLPKAPVISVVAITYLDFGGTRRVVDPSSYVVDTISEPARVAPIAGSYWPYLEAFQPGGVQVEYTTGYGDDPSSVPASITNAILLLVGHLYSNREATSPGVSVSNIPLAVDALLGGYTLTTFSYGS